MKRLLICSTELGNFNTADVAALVNRLQLFFVVTRFEQSIAFTPDLLARPLLEPEELASHCRGVLAGYTHRKEFVIILTSARLLVAAGSSVWSMEDIAVVSNQEWEEQGESAVLRFARHILHLGMEKVLTHRSNVLSCIGATADRFDCLCYDCEAQLRAKGFRDGIARLKEGFNILNQLEYDIGLDILPPDSNLLTTRLRLAETYVAALSQSSEAFADVTVLIVLHFLSDLVPFVHALAGIGVRFSNIYLVAKPYPYSKRDEVSHVLESLGVNTTRASSARSVEQCVQEVLTVLAKRDFGDSEKILIIEDGGYFAPAMHAGFGELLRRCVGVVEQTQKGANADKQIKTPLVPILSVAESTFKKAYESPEIGRVAIQNISRFTPNMKLSGGNAVVFGFGSVGQEVAFHLTNAFNMTVSVVEDHDLPLLRARHRRSIVAEAHKTFDELSFRRPDLIVGTTGTTSVTRQVIQALERDTILVSTSSDQIEIDLTALKELSTRSCEIEEGKTKYIIASEDGEIALILIAEGYPINFYGSESVPNDTIDPIMTLLLLCGAELVTRPPESVGVLEGQVDKIADRHQLIERFLRLGPSRNY
jgi:adenosylhomocysteinase